MKSTKDSSHNIQQQIVWQVWNIVIQNRIPLTLSTEVWYGMILRIQWI